MRPGIPVVDTHVHLWDLTHPELRYDWLAPEAVHPILGDIDAIKSVKFDAGALVAESRFADVTAFVHVQAAIGSPDPVEETRWLDGQYRAAALRGAVVAYVDLAADDVGRQLDAHRQASELFRGVRDFATEPYLAGGEIDRRYEQALDELSESGLVLDLDCEWPNMAAAAQLAERHPGLRIVLEHLGYPRRRDDAYFAEWSKAIGVLAGAENVVCKISGIGMTDRLFTPDRLRPWARRCLEAFGPARCVVGSNWPVDRIASSYDVVLGLYREFVADLTEQEQHAVLAANALAVYGIG